MDVRLTDSPDSPPRNDIEDFKTVRGDTAEQATVVASSDSEGEMGLRRRSKRGTLGQTPKRFLKDSEDEETPAWMAGSDDEEEEDVVRLRRHSCICGESVYAFALSS